MEECMWRVSYLVFVTDSFALDDSQNGDDNSSGALYLCRMTCFATNTVVSIIVVHHRMPNSISQIHVRDKNEKLVTLPEV